MHLIFINIFYRSNEDERPVKLQKIVLGYYYKSSGFQFDVNLTYKLKPLILQYSNGQPTLVRKEITF